MLEHQLKTTRKSGFLFAASATAFALCVVVLGAFTRLVDCRPWLS